MGFFERLERLREAPRGKRQLALAITVIIMMVIIIGVWTRQFNRTILHPATASSAETSTAFMGPLKLLWSSLFRN